MVKLILDHVHLRTASLARTIQFYESLGFRTAKIPWGKGEYVFIGLDRGGIDPSPALGPADRSPFTIGISIDNVEEVYKRAEACGAEIVDGLKDRPWGVRNFYVRDPDGNQLEFSQDIGP